MAIRNFEDSSTFCFSKKYIYSLFIEWKNHYNIFSTGNKDEDNVFFKTSFKLYLQKLYTYYPNGFKNLPNEINLYQISEKTSIEPEDGFNFRKEIFHNEHLLSSFWCYSKTDTIFIKKIKVKSSDIDVKKTFINLIEDPFVEQIYMKKGFNFNVIYDDKLLNIY